MSTLISTAITAAVIVAVLIMLIRALIFFHKKQKQKAADEFQEHYRQVLKTNNLSFSTPELLKDAAIGLDEIHRKLLILKLADDDKYDSQVIDLDMVKNCKVRKSNHKVFANGYNSNKSDGFVDEVVLEIEFLNGKENVEILFYKHIINDFTHLHGLEAKARKWESIISGAIENKLQKIA